MRRGFLPLMLGLAIMNTGAYNGWFGNKISGQNFKEGVRGIKSKKRRHKNRLKGKKKRK